MREWAEYTEAASGDTASTQEFAFEIVSINCKYHAC